MLRNVGTSAHVWGKGMAYTKDMDDAYEWLVNVNDKTNERFDVSLDEFQKFGKKEQETGHSMSALANSENEFQLVCGKKKKGAGLLEPGKEVELDSSSASGVKIATEDRKTTVPKLKVPFHIPTIRRPQDEYNILVNNSNQPFEHVWLQRSDDGRKFIHPLEKLSALDFVDKDCGDVKPIRPPSIECTPFKILNDVKDLKELAAKLHAIKEFAVDLEHNQYRSFQGLTCLMQISTRTEDFVIDTLKLRIHIGPYLREVFKDPTKRKVMHGANQDILWLQRDFGIYICNLFDTGQASRVLKLERNSLEYLLRYYCGVTANKEYQSADWRLRPLPNQMLRYAREDTHYLLYIYDIMRMKLFGLSRASQNSDNPLLEVYRLSYDVCMQLYEKELLTENSYLYIYGLRGAGFNAQQLAIVSGLYQWRDIVARAEDESTGYVLPNKTLLEIAKQMPVTTSKLHKLLKSKHPYVECNYDSIVSIIIHSMQNASAFEAVAQKLKEGHVTTASSVIPDKYRTEAPLPKMPNSKIRNARKESIGVESVQSPFSLPQQNRGTNTSISSAAKGYGTNIQVLEKPGSALGAPLENSASKRKPNSDRGEEDVYLEQIRSSVDIPFYSFLGSNDMSRLVVETPSIAFKTSDAQKPVKDPDDMACNNLESTNELRENSPSSISGKEEEQEAMSLSELSLNFRKCFQTSIQDKSRLSQKI